MTAGHAGLIRAHGLGLGLGLGFAPDDRARANVTNGSRSKPRDCPGFGSTYAAVYWPRETFLMSALRISAWFTIVRKLGEVVR